MPQMFRRYLIFENVQGDSRKKIKANSAKLNSSTKNKIDMEMKKLRRQGKNGFEKSGMFTKAQMDAAKKRINEMLKEK